MAESKNDEKVNTQRRNALERAREKIELWRRLADSNLRIAPHAQNLVNAVEDEFQDV